MPRYGFNGELTEMKIFLLFIMRHIPDPIALDEMGEATLIDDNMNYFLFCQGVEELANSGLLLVEKDSKGRDVYTLSPRGFETLLPVERALPVALRRAGQENALRVLSRMRLQSRVKTEVWMREGEHMVRLALTDGLDPILRIEVVCGSREKASQMCKYFSENAETIFDGVMKTLLPGDAP
ncbi:MAG: DUF4364 family protein [Oscillospiraceae bacterium]|nr:DUF4364 family protein [Oscillospiraceae bacterium]